MSNPPTPQRKELLIHLSSYSEVINVSILAVGREERKKANYAFSLKRKKRWVKMSG